MDFDKIYIINLKHRTDRWDQIVHEFKKHNISMQNVIRWDAVNGKNMSNDEIAQNTETFCRYFCNKGTVGCFLSHRGVWADVAKHGYRKVLILEDDIEFSDDFVQKMGTYDVPDDWEIIFAGSYGSTVSNFCSNTQVTENVVKPCWISGTHGYILNEKSANKLLNTFPKATYHVDISINARKDLNIYAFSPPLIFQSESETDIQTSSDSLLSKMCGKYFLGAPSKSFWHTSLINVGGLDITWILIIQILGGLVGGYFNVPALSIAAVILSLSADMKGNLIVMMLVGLFYLAGLKYRS